MSGKKSTKWSEVKVVWSVDGEGVADFLYEVIHYRLNVPLELLSNSGPSFRSKMMDHLHEKLRISIISALHPIIHNVMD